MKVPISWLKDFVDITLPLEELAHEMTMAGLEVDSIEAAAGQFNKVVVAQVKSVQKHPDADKLLVLTVDTAGIGDADGLGAFSYQWYRDGIAITGATGVNYTLGDTDVGTKITVEVSYLDCQGTNE